MTIRKIIKIDEDLCDGCGLCVPACVEGAIQIIDGKARLMRDDFCDGLGACLGDCPTGALTIEEREAPSFDEASVKEHLSKSGSHDSEARKPEFRPLPMSNTGGGFGCPSTRQIDLRAGTKPTRAKPWGMDVAEKSEQESSDSELGHWPVKLKLVPPSATFLREADLVLAADCAPFAFANFHPAFLRDNVVLIGCPKFDDYFEARDRLTGILRDSGARSLTVVTMEVPCCFGYLKMAQEALSESGRAGDIPLKQIVIGIRGQIVTPESKVEIPESKIETRESKARL